MSSDNGHDPAATWQGYSLDGALNRAENLEHAALAFREKFGYAPVETRWAGCVILAGPIGERPRGLLARAVNASRAAVELTAAEAAERALQLALEFGGMK